MLPKYKLGLTRNRLFEFDNCVSFCGKIEGGFNIAECEKALKMLWVKEPLLSGVIELEADGKAYVVTGRVEPRLELVEIDAQSYIYKKKLDGVDFTKELFSFAVAEGNTLCICAHTTVADSRTLLYLASQLMAFYNKESVSVEPSEVEIISDVADMPSNAFSVVVDRLASGLEVGWQKKPASFTVADYKKAREKYMAKKSPVGVIERPLSQELVDSLKVFAQREGADVSSLVAFAFYENLCSTLGGRRKYRKLNVQSNSRAFFEKGSAMSVGAFNSFFTVAKKKDKKLAETLQNNAVGFHKEIYKKAIGAFSTFYNEFLFMRLPESFADSQYMYCAGEFRHKYSQKLAETYGCASEVVGEFTSVNLNQRFWSGLGPFAEVVASEPLKMRSTTILSLVQNSKYNVLLFEYKKDKLSDEAALALVENSIKILENLK